MAGPGTHLHDLIECWTGEKPNMSCSCRKWIKKMDKEGPGWCRAHLQEIVAKLRLEARRRAKLWRAVPVDEHGQPQNLVRSVLWKGAFMIPGSGLLVVQFVRRMILRAISLAEKDLEEKP